MEVEMTPCTLLQHLHEPNSCTDSFSLQGDCWCPTLSSLDALSGSSLMSLYIGCLDTDRPLRWAIFRGPIFFTSDLGPFFMPWWDNRMETERRWPCVVSWCEVYRRGGTVCQQCRRPSFLKQSCHILTICFWGCLCLTRAPQYIRVKRRVVGKQTPPKLSTAAATERDMKLEWDWVFKHL